MTKVDPESEIEVNKSELFSWNTLAEMFPGVDQDFEVLSNFVLLFVRKEIYDKTVNAVPLNDIATVDDVVAGTKKNEREICFSFTDPTHGDLEDIELIDINAARFLIGKATIEIVSLEEAMSNKEDTDN